MDLFHSDAWRVSEYDEELYSLPDGLMDSLITNPPVSDSTTNHPLVPNDATNYLLVPNTTTNDPESQINQCVIQLYNILGEKSQQEPKMKRAFQLVKELKRVLQEDSSTTFVPPLQIMKSSKTPDIVFRLELIWIAKGKPQGKVHQDGLLVKYGIPLRFVFKSSDSQLKTSFKILTVSSSEPLQLQTHYQFNEMFTILFPKQKKDQQQLILRFEVGDGEYQIDYKFYVYSSTKYKRQ